MHCVAAKVAPHFGVSSNYITSGGCTNVLLGNTSVIQKCRPDCARIRFWEQAARRWRHQRHDPSRWNQPGFRSSARALHETPAARECRIGQDPSNSDDYSDDYRYRDMVKGRLIWFVTRLGSSRGRSGSEHREEPLGDRRENAGAQSFADLSGLPADSGGFVQPSVSPENPEGCFSPLPLAMRPDNRLAAGRRKT
jgi:hypothetical protein